ARGKVGQQSIRRLLSDPRFDAFVVRALCHNRRLAEGPRLEVETGSMSERADVERAMQGVTHVLHLATSKETPESIMDVAIKGMFWLLEAARNSDCFRQFLLVDRKSTRLNSSHVKISYAVFCLKTKSA